ncbi:MAG TPA: SOS response-associated peptidase [Bacillota bacterium]|nr:SOS response-associated peptidase [Bacillota bacterium]
MCGRYTLTVSKSHLESYFSTDVNEQSYELSYNIAPSQNVLAVIHDGKEKRVGTLKWGLVPSWSKDKKIGNKMINARLETAHEKPSFKRLMERKRCLIVADSFYEWKQNREQKNPFRIHVKDRTLFTFAGLWDKWTDGVETLFTCTMLTTEANSFMESIHHRMPIILPKDKEEEWLDPHVKRAEDAKRFLDDIQMETLEAYPVSSHVNYVKNNDAKCIEIYEQ